MSDIDSGAITAKETIDTVAGSLGQRRPDMRGLTAADGNVTLMFSDMEGFTPMTERLGDRAARDVIREHNRIVREQLSNFDGSEVEMQGDAFLLAFPRPEKALSCAIAIQRALAERNIRAEEPIRVRIGLHSGEALRDADRFFGLTVILSARIAAIAAADEILVSSALHEQLEGTFRFGADRKVDLKGITGPQLLFSVDWR